MQIYENVADIQSADIYRHYYRQILSADSHIGRTLDSAFGVSAKKSASVDHYIPVTMTALAMLSEKSIPSATLPRQTANKQMPPTLDVEATLAVLGAILI